MPFEKVDTQVDFPALERRMLTFWEEIRAFDQLREKNKNGPRWSFLDGPITANNPMGVHHAWGRTYKDAYQRFHAMLGQRQRYQNGFDCQGLWVEVEVEKELGLKSKRDIESLVPGDETASIDRFVNLCKARVDKFARVQTEQSVRLGYWMDWDRTDEDWAKPAGQRKSYFTMSEENNYAIWGFLKKCHERGFTYRGYDAMPWCPRCGVGLAEMEVKEGYKQVEHTAVFVKFPLVGRPGENLLVWTTTPWTLSSNVAAAVNPELTYLKVRLKDETFYLAKGAFKADRTAGGAADVEDEGDQTPGKAKGMRLKSLEQLFKEKAKEGAEVVGEVKGADMVGWTYEGPFDDLDATGHTCGYPEELADVVRKQKWAGEVSARQSHRVIAWKDVGETEGTGIVHIAPGCGKEDFHLGKEQGLPPVAPLDEEGVFLPGFGPLTGKSAVSPEVPTLVFEELKRKGRLFATEKYSHRYPHCWRCKTELLFRLVDEWFINMNWRDEIIAVSDRVDYVPASVAGKAKERNWLENMGDWMISKKRFWGLALPIWVDDVTGEYTVIGSYEELKERAVEGWEQFEGHSPHRPWVDLVKLRNPKTGNLMSRIADVGNPWLDAGIVPYSTMGYNTNHEEWKKWFPADFITESFPGQFRNWFYAILAMSTMLENTPPMKVLLGHALVRDQKGEEMHKGKGNSIEFNGAAEGGYELFHDRDPKLTVEAQAKRDLPAGYLSCSEGEAVIDGKPRKVVKGRYKPMGADVIRWIYCRHNPSANVNIGPGPADELRSRFVLKVWNSYKFLCDLACVDGFDPTQPAVPAERRSDLDRWLLGKLQKLAQTAREAFAKYDVMSFCLAAESFVDDVLSNWYIRRSKPRFNKPGGWDEDKSAAFQTLYSVLVNFAKLCAPVMPFLTEVMYQNLVVNTHPAGSVPESVHLCDYPEADATLIDEQLVNDVDALLSLKQMGLAARNLVKIKVRQPMAELRVSPGSDGHRRAVERFADLLCDELNVKRVTLVTGPLLTQEAKPNARTMGPRFGAQLKQAQAAVALASAADLAALVQKGEPFALGGLEFAPEDVSISYRAAEGWAGVEEKGTQVALDATLTDALKSEGLARDVIRLVQEMRKEACLQIEDRIVLHLGAAEGGLREAIETHRAYVASETLTATWAQSPPAGATTKAVKVEGQELMIALAKA